MDIDHEAIKASLKQRCDNCKHSQRVTGQNDHGSIDGLYCYHPDVVGESLITHAVIPTLCDVKPCGHNLPKWEKQ